ncbi:MAG: type II secretion system protein [Thermodesulfobacteriota bacterium]|nr:type II secretion system protein [Thermodesulfobacteriota bacterium]
MTSSCHGFSLLEVLIAITLLSLIAATALGLTGYHKSAATRVDARFALNNQAAALIADLPMILKEDDPEFPVLEEDEAFREFTGTENEMTWVAKLSRVKTAGVFRLYRLKLTVRSRDEKAELTNYILQEEKTEEDGN